MDLFTYEDMKLIHRKTLGDSVPLELFRSVRLIGMYQGLPMKGASTTKTVGRKIGQSLPVENMEEVLSFFKELKIGIPSIIESTEKEIHIRIDDCFCKGLPTHPGNKTCDLEGAILEGAISRFNNGKVMVKEVKCNVNGDPYCEYCIKLL
ncbi:MULTISPECIES: V4R domain-containing protein [Neobacillus]|jgi:uncharacterized protein|uniref:4-vinyl reductase n=2 Tax=Neobacillus TaxID=2675232 RepID=A0A6B3TSK5_9BACI|nr:MULTISPECIES: V4R domain-containing protein [Neobacillus]MCD4838281.1 4-vinyl reductase [Neobacillus sedimentimangrovi]MED3625202.1 4-vinyl reductase [Neobacillus thermocopriae]MED3715118.1 4-vinyl reductase [Neobacillus thermocopriae]NEX80035.1 4-vinyl reductase [Neobacillus thermocopriae]